MIKAFDHIDVRQSTPEPAHNDNSDLNLDLAFPIPFNDEDAQIFADFFL